MPYFLLLLGTILIFISLKMNKNMGEEDENIGLFQKMLKEKLEKKEHEPLKDNFSDLLSRLENLETSVLMFGDTPEAAAEENELQLSKPTQIQEKGSEAFRPEDALAVNINNKIFNLYDNGMDIEDICSALNLGKGEVLLRLGLRRQ